MQLETITLIEQPCIVCSEDHGKKTPVSTALKKQDDTSLVVYLCDEHRTEENYIRYSQGE